MRDRNNLTQWCRWLRSVGLPTDHIALLVDLEPLEVHFYLAIPRRNGPVRIPAWNLYGDATSRRAIHNETATKVRVLHGLGYTSARIASVLVLEHETVRGFLRRTNPFRKDAIVKPRTASEQRRLEVNRRRRAKRARIAAKIAADKALWKLQASNRDDDGCEALAQPAADLANHELINAAPSPPPAPTRWEGQSNPRRVDSQCHGSAKLTWPDVREVRRLHSEGVSCYALARRFGVSWGTINGVVKWLTWREPESAEIPRHAPAEPETAKPAPQNWKFAAIVAPCAR